jgi:ParB-like nuclease domain
MTGKNSRKEGFTHMSSHPQGLQIQSWAIERLIPYARKARTHSKAQIAQIAASMAEFGMNNPVLIDPGGGIIAGHGRVLAARKLACSHVPVIVLSHLTPNQKRAFMLADNKLAVNAGWDVEMLRLELEALAEQDFPVSLTGFDEEELTRLLAQQDNSVAADPDEAPEPQPGVITARGDMWRLGPHRLFCADATNPESLRSVLDGAPCDLVFTHLPYDGDGCGKEPDRMKVASDQPGAEFGRFLGAACRSILSVCAGPIYLCIPSSALHPLQAAFTQAGGLWSATIIWATGLFTRGGPIISGSTNQCSMAGARAPSITGVEPATRATCGWSTSRAPVTSSRRSCP